MTEKEKNDLIEECIGDLVDLKSYIKEAVFTCTDTKYQIGFRLGIIISYVNDVQAKLDRITK